MNLKRFVLSFAALAVTVPSVSAQQAPEVLPNIVQHAEPIYLPLAAQTRLTGDVRIEFSTDGESVTEVVVESGHLFVFRGRRGDLIKVLWFDGDGLCLFAKRLERGRFIWPQAVDGTVSLSPAQLSMLLEGIDWRRPVRTQVPQLAV